MQHPDGVRIIKLCCASLLLPEDLWQIGLNHIVQKAAHSFVEEVRRSSVNLFLFIEREWLASTAEVNLCGSFEGTHYSNRDLGLKLDRHLMPANDSYFIIKYIRTSITISHQKITTVVSGSHLTNSQPTSIAAELPYWNLLRASGFPPECNAICILNYVSDKLMI
ncbi:Non-structural protein 4 [Frankliniella fusca]|uniref:Non-structural protein 4 n=1 Tax=Frankliniella fusca TaxID=407009 RepID=A0AAE1LH08_9NEOP|nr:Non-structural protein 4 [Frankliniella fusca]